MLVDTHTHIFPDALAARVIPHMAQVCGTVPSTEGTLDSLLASMEKNHVDRSIILPVVTAPRQFDSINRFAAEANEKNENLCSFGGIHPDCEDLHGKLRLLQKNGFIGIKLHPDYQNHMVDDPCMIETVGEAVALGMYVVIHAGFDPVSPDLVHAPPVRSRHLIDAVGETGPSHIILAHMGGSEQFDEVRQYLIGTNVLLDTAYVVDRMPAQELEELILAHGANRVLFASDSPWGDVGKFANMVRALSLSDQQKEQILYQNALDLFF